MTTEGSVGGDAQELWRVQAEAQSFRARGEPVFPGSLIVQSGGSFPIHPVDDEAFDPSTEQIIGIAMWGAQVPLQAGMPLVEEGPERKSAPVVAGETGRPTTGVGRVDAWIARADALRKIRCGTAVPIGVIPLTQLQLIASVGEIEKLVRESAIKLLQEVPQDQRPALLALARVADTQHPQDAELTAAILELVASAAAWNAPRQPKVAPERLTGLEAAAATGARDDTPNGSLADLPDDGHARPALTTSQSRVLQTMARFDGSQLLTTEKIAAEMDAATRLSEETVRQCVGKLIESNLAERPEGERSGARLNNAGRKLAGKIAD